MSGRKNKIIRAFPACYSSSCQWCLVEEDYFVVVVVYLALPGFRASPVRLRFH